MRLSLTCLGVVLLSVAIGRGEGGKPATNAGRQASAVAEPINFDRDVRPIFSNICFKCHGPDKKGRKAKLRLDIREAAIQRGAFVPGKPGESELVARVFSTDPETLMPPPKSNKKLTTEQKRS